MFKPRRGGGIFRNGFVCRPGGAWFFGGIVPQLKLRAILDFLAERRRLARNWMAK
jgi:hypothetical protein